MTNYVDTEKLYKQVDELMAHFAELENETKLGNEDLSIFYQGKKEMCSELLGIIDSLQQEQPEVDLDKEMDKYYGMYRDKTGKTYDVKDDEPCFDWKEDELSEHEMRMARHFYELGRTEGIKGNLEEIPSNVDLEKELQAFLCNYDYEFDDDPVPFDIATHFYELGLNARKEE